MRIRDGDPATKGGANLSLGIFSRNCMKMKKIGLGGMGVKKFFIEDEVNVQHKKSS